MSVYVQIDGADGCGKSSQAAALVGWLRAQARAVLHVREPGSTPVGEALRRLLLSPATGNLQPVTEALLFSAARAELVAQQIAPAEIGERIPLAAVDTVHQVEHPGAFYGQGNGGQCRRKRVGCWFRH